MRTKNTEDRHVVTFSVSKHAVGLLSLILLLMASSFVQAAEWGWRVESVTNPATGAQAPGPTTVFPTKEGALAAARAMFPPNSSGIDYELKIVSMTTTAVTYQYIYEPKEPEYGAWSYTVWSRSNNQFYSQIAGPFASEAEAANALEVWRTTVAAPGPPPCVPPTLVPMSPDWVNHDTVSMPYGNEREVKWYNLQYILCSGGFYQYVQAELRRQRMITCADGEGGRRYRLTAAAPFCWQGKGSEDRAMSAFIIGNLLECPSGFSSPAALVGDPCNAGNGDFLITETDHASEKLRFTRTYHSAASQGSAMGWGWSHNHGARVVPIRNSNTATVGLLRPGGTHDDLVYTSGTYRSTAGSIVSGTVSSPFFVVKLRDGSQEKYNWGTGNLLELIDPAGVVTKLNYSAGGRLVSVTDSNGNSIHFSYTRNLLTRMTDPAGRHTSYHYDAKGNLERVTFPDGTTRRYKYENASFPHHMTSIWDESNTQLTRIEYDSVGRVIMSERAGGADRVDIVYTGNISTVTDALGGVTQYTFTSTSEPPRVRSVSRGGRVHSYRLDSHRQRRVFEMTDPNGVVTEYDHEGELLGRQTEAAGTDNARSTLLSYATSSSTLPASIETRDANGVTQRLVSITYNTQNRPTTIATTAPTPTGPVTRTVQKTYDTAGRLTSEDGPRTDVSDVTTYTYYSCTTGFQCGQVETITNAVGHITTYNTYNAHGQPLTITDPNGLVMTLTYDLRQRVTSKTVGSEQTTFDYWPTGLLKKATLPDGSFLEYTYDGAHRLTEIEDSEGNRIVYTLDAMGNRTQEDLYDPLSALTQTRTRVFNALNQLWKEIGAAGTAAVTATFAYDNNGNQTNINAPLARNTAQAYDELNRLKQAIDPLSGVTLYGYNALDQLISVTDPRSKVTTYTYNALGDLKQQVSPDTGTTVNTYDSGGNLATSTDARSKTGTYAYDALNRVTSLTYPDQTITYAYDTGQKGRLTQVSDASGSTSWGYDAHGRVLTKQQTMGSVSKTVGYAYDSFGRLQTLTLPSSNTITYGYTDGKVTSFTLNGSTTILSNVLYEPFGPTTGWTWGNSTLAVREYDADGKITDIDSAGLKTYSYDDAFRITGITDAGDPNLSQTYGYDLLDRLTSAAGTGLNQSWTYDSNGNRLTQTGGDPSTYTISSTNNRITSIAGSLARIYGYDNAGNTTSDGAVTFTYNDAGRMVSATKSGVATNYSLNALGQRVRKGTGGTSTYFVYDEDGRLIGEYDSSGNLLQETVWLGDTPVAALKPNGGSGVTAFYIHADHLDTPRRISRPSDNVIVWRWDADPFGAASANEDPDGDTQSFTFNLRFPGQYLDSETALHYNYFRDYDPQVGRYVQSDPVGLWGGLNTYAYVDSNPLSYSDPEGLTPAHALRGAWWAGTRIGGGINYGIQAATGASLGSLIYDMCNESEEEKLRKRCQALKDSILNTCSGLTGRKRMACFEAANTSFRQCMGWE